MSKYCKFSVSSHCAASCYYPNHLAPPCRATYPQSLWRQSVGCHVREVNGNAAAVSDVSSRAGSCLCIHGRHDTGCSTAASAASCCCRAVLPASAMGATSSGSAAAAAAGAPALSAVSHAGAVAAPVPAGAAAVASASAAATVPDDGTSYAKDWKMTARKSNQKYSE